MGNFKILRRTGGQLLKAGLALCILALSRIAVNAQCSGTLATHTYDTAFNNTGYGVIPINIPQWSPDSGLLVSVKLAANVSSQYAYSLRNATSASASYALSLGQLDQFNSPALAAPYSNVMMQQIDSFTLIPGQSVSNGPFAFLNNHVSSDSITNNVAPFLGAGQVSLKYTSFTFTDLNSYNNATYSYSATIANTMHFTVSYLYCQATTTSVLAVTLSNWGAQLVGNSAAELKWTAANETTGRSYDVQRSGDGKTFLTIHTVAAINGQTEDYDYTDNFPVSASGNWFYRLQIHDNSGAVTYSAIKEVSPVAASTTRLAVDSSFTLYPNPSDTYINVNTGGTNATWQADIMALNGTVVQRGVYSESGTVHIAFTSRLAAGEYFVRLTEQGGTKSFVSKFIVMHGN